MEENRRDVYLVTNEEAEACMKNYNMKRRDYHPNASPSKIIAE